MNKTKLGITPNAYAALVFAVGLLGILPALILAGAALILEENEWLKRMSAKAIAFIVVIKIFSVLLLLLPDFLGIIQDFMILAESNSSVEVLAKINYFFTILDDALTIFSSIMLLIYAYQAYCGKYAKVLFVEGMVNKNM